jgi:hypothetical protein
MSWAKFGRAYGTGFQDAYFRPVREQAFVHAAPNTHDANRRWRSKIDPPNNC